MLHQHDTFFQLYFQYVLTNLHINKKLYAMINENNKKLCFLFQGLVKYTRRIDVNSKI